MTWLTPLTRKRWRRFRQLRRAWWSFLLLAALYLLTLAAELFCNSAPLILRHQGKWYFPAFRFHPESAFIPGGKSTRADYLALDRQGVFRDSFALWPICRNDPYRIIPPAELDHALRDEVRLLPVLPVAGITIDKQLRITRAQGLETLLPQNATPPDTPRRPLADFWILPAELPAQLASRFDGRDASALELTLAPTPDSPFPPVALTLPATEPRARRTLRLRLLDASPDAPKDRTWLFAPGADTPRQDADAFAALPQPARDAIAEARRALRQGATPPEQTLEVGGRPCRLLVEREAVRYPFRPAPGHWLGLDDAGRDLFARIFYALRIALNFGLILVLCSMSAGSFFGMLQGYLGGAVDILGQRLIEIWSALPFLYIMILMGSIYGTGFTLLIVCYALFNWIGISHYMRAETLRLRRQPFVEAAKCMGISGWRIAWKHILPNALVPLITFFPFSLVGAIGSLAALDYLGFGLPVPTPSLGELLAQAQAPGQRHAWWLVLYPSLALFTVMLLGVFIGEGIRNAFDPRRQNRLQ